MTFTIEITWAKLLNAYGWLSIVWTSACICVGVTYALDSKLNLGDQIKGRSIIKIDSEIPVNPDGSFGSVRETTYKSVIAYTLVS